MTGEAGRKGEFNLISSVFAPLTGGDKRALGLLDDGAVLPQLPGRDTVITTDTLVAGIHFLASEPAEVIARRLLRVNLSDIAAMGGEPAAYFLNLTVSPETGDSWLAEFAHGLQLDQTTYGVVLLGGDTTHTTGPLTLSVTMLGEVPGGEAVTRSGAQTGDLVFVSGTIGDAGAGLRLLQSGADPEEFLVRRYQLPDPRVSLGPALRGVATSMADISDGLAADLGHICNASDKSASIAAADLPLSDNIRALLASGDTTIAEIVSGGDDYELVFTVPSANVGRLSDVASASGIAVTQIGKMEEGPAGVDIRDADGAALNVPHPGYRHF